MSRHCRRRTHGVQKTKCLINEMMETFLVDTDTTGIPLLDRQDIWATERKHVACIQDPPDVRLYTRTGQVTMRWVSLPMYRCARWAFHLHRFIPAEKSDQNTTNA